MESVRRLRTNFIANLPFSILVFTFIRIHRGLSVVGKIGTRGTRPSEKMAARTDAMFWG